MTAQTEKKECKSWDPVWDEIFASEAWGKYPPEEFIRFIARNYYKVEDRSQVKVLEIGSGAGACVWFVAREGFSACGIDGSQIAVERSIKLLDSDGLSANLVCGDVIELDRHFADQQFDVIYDVGCLQCNKFSNMQQIMEQVFKHLLPGGRFFSIMAHEDIASSLGGKEIEPNTFVDIEKGPLTGRGLNHITTREELDILFEKFENVEIDYTERSLNNQSAVYKYWVCAAVKPEK